MIILFKFEVVLKIMYNMASLNINFTLNASVLSNKKRNLRTKSYLADPIEQDVSIILSTLCYGDTHMIKF